jgi:hypothetical protein
VCSCGVATILRMKHSTVLQKKEARERVRLDARCGCYGFELFGMITTSQKDSLGYGHRYGLEATVRILKFGPLFHSISPKYRTHVKCT